MSGARPALRGDNRETSGYVVETDCGRPPPNRHNRYSRKTLNRPLCFYARPSRPSCAFRGPHTAMCHGAPGHERVFQRFVFWTGRTNPPSAQLRGRGSELPLNRHGHVIERLLGLDAIAPSSGCGSPEGGRSCRLGAHRRPMPGGRLVRMDCSSACRSLRLFELRATFFAGPEAWPTGNGICPLPQKNGSRASRLPFANSNCHP